ncbi:hypothetical Protein YC6258_00798 [Gynuella sunshinyii YC6258]|uniref:Uncharacterized protein n=1 Tax=Gynuella sunshinyii YC6258 TaxID=1445510 RepID=A0A0C5VHM7_9GAMM|nr:hypothetical Protein YC6258_00798 [Gynuella sunshinyii YC6258]
MGEVESFYKTMADCQLLPKIQETFITFTSSHRLDEIYLYYSEG